MIYILLGLLLAWLYGAYELWKITFGKYKPDYSKLSRNECLMMGLNPYYRKYSDKELKEIHDNIVEEEED